MSHEYENGFQVEKPAWHGLGRTLPKNDPACTNIQEAILASGLGWKAVKVPLVVSRQETYFVDDKEVPIPAHLRGAEATGRFGVYRDSDWKFIGDVGSKYTILQNEKAFQWFQPWLDQGTVKFDTAGSLYNGAVVWVLAKVQQDNDEIVPGDAISRYILLSTSHDGSQATYAGFSGIRVVCANTLRMAHSGSNKLLKCRHTKSQEDTLKLIQKTMNLANEEFNATAEQYRQLAKATINADDLVKYVKIVLEVDEKQKMSSTRSNQIDKIVDNFRNGRGSELAGNTVWGAYNAVTEYLSYSRGTAGEKRLKSLWFGNSAKMNQRALDAAIELAV